MAKPFDRFHYIFVVNVFSRIITSHFAYLRLCRGPLRHLK